MQETFNIIGGLITIVAGSVVVWAMVVLLGIGCGASDDTCCDELLDPLRQPCE